jgi:hypothetical protein
MSHTAFSPISADKFTYTTAGDPMHKALFPWKDGEPIWIDVVTGSPEMTAAQLETVNRELGWFWENFHLLEEQFGEGSELLNEKNANLFEDEETYDAETFYSMVLLEAIQLNFAQEALESVQFWYDDGDTFAGCSIMIEWKDRAIKGIEIKD